MKQSERLEALRARIADVVGRYFYRLPFTADDDQVLREVIQMTTRLEAAGAEGFHVASMVSARTGKAAVDVAWLGAVAQIEPVKAREIAWMLLEAASIAETDATVLGWARDELSMPTEKASELLALLRIYREREGGSLLGTDGKPTH